MTPEHVANDLEAIAWHQGALDLSADSEVATVLRDPDLLSLAIGYAVQRLTVTVAGGVMYPYPRYSSDGDHRRH